MQESDSQIKWVDDTPASLIFDDIFFNTDDAILESRYVFIEGNQLKQRFINWPFDVFNIGETGFGTGLNFLTLCQLFSEFKRDYPDAVLKRVNYYSVEKYPLPLNDFKTIHDKTGMSDGFSPFSQTLQQHWPLNTQIALSDSIQLSVLYDDVMQLSPYLIKNNIKVNAWFLDGFAPSKNEAMWSEALFQGLYQCSATECSFATFTASSQVKRNLMSAGFQVSKRKGFGKKREMLIGVK